jgi:hypothetical protein
MPGPPIHVRRNQRGAHFELSHEVHDGLTDENGNPLPDGWILHTEDGEEQIMANRFLEAVDEAIAVSEVPPERIHYRDSKSCLTILLDNNNRKPIIRLNLNGKSVKFVTTFEQGKDVGVRRDIASVVDIYKVASDEIRQTIRRYESGGALIESSITEGG